jgi:cystinosin
MVFVNDARASQRLPYHLSQQQKQTQTNSMTAPPPPRPPLDGRASPTTPLLPPGATEESTASVPPPHLLYMRYVRWLAAPFLDEGGSPGAVATGVVTLGVVGTMIGVLATATTNSQSSDFNGHIYPYVSSSLGYTYFLMWSISFYPQVLTNYHRRTTSGLSVDFCLLNVIGFACYATYNLSLFYNDDLRRLYRERHGGGDVVIPVRSNDVAFAVHALVLASITLCQILYYDGVQTKPSTIIGAFIVVIIFIIGLYPVGMILFPVVLGGDALDFIYLLSYIKMAITVVKYMPQVIMNYQRQSTTGWSIWQIVLDFGGGGLSDLQLVLDCWNLQNWSGITGNLAKFALGMVSIVFDIVFLIQHYMLYGNNGHNGDRSTSDRRPPNDAEAMERLPILPVVESAAVEDGAESSSRDDAAAAAATTRSADEAVSSGEPC